ncbi:MAG TPA: hypothetical protein P5136_00135 [Methanofastidiosum sp.]|nr:hypothetical protein [Methanofastidiosum sp.]
MSRIYTASTRISYMTQTVVPDLNMIFDHSLSKLGQEFMIKLYRERPELFSQENHGDAFYTDYKVDLAVLSLEEYNLLIRFLREIKRRFDLNVPLPI